MALEIRFTNHFLHKLEDLFSETDYMLRYEKGRFQSGYCILKDTKVAVINKYFSLEGKINSLIEILRTIELDTENLSDKNKKLYQEITSKSLQS